MRDRRELQSLMLPRQNRSVPERLESGCRNAVYFGKVYKKEFIGDDLCFIYLGKIL